MIPDGRRGARARPARSCRPDRGVLRQRSRRRATRSTTSASTRVLARSRAARREFVAEGRGRARSDGTIELLGGGALPAPGLGARGAAARRRASTAPEDVERLRQDFHAVHEELFAISDRGRRSRSSPGARACTAGLRRDGRAPATRARGDTAASHDAARVYFAGAGAVDATVARSRRSSPRRQRCPAPRSSSRRSPPSSSTRARAVARQPTSGAVSRRRRPSAMDAMTPCRRATASRQAAGPPLDGSQLAVLNNRLEGVVPSDDEHPAPHRRARACSTRRATSRAASSRATTSSSRWPRACRSTCSAGPT